MEIKINKEINDYTDQVVWGLSARQALFSGLAIVVAGTVYFTLSARLGEFFTVLLIVFTAGPVALLGFIKYNGMYFERLVVCILRSFRMNKKLCWRAKSAYKWLEEVDALEARKERVVIKIVIDERKEQSKDDE